METDAFVPEQIHLSLPSQRQSVEAFLRAQGLRLEGERLDYYAVLCDYEDRVVGGGGFCGSTIKCIAIDPKMRGMGLTNVLVSHLRSEMVARGVTDIFVYTKPENKHIFANLAFYLVGTAPRAILMESSKRGVLRLGARLAKHRRPGVSGAIVMNANPFTNGHLYLVQRALESCDNLYIFPVRTENSAFSYSMRLEMITAAVSGLRNVQVLDGGEYIVSGSTFPTYFLKELSEKGETQAALDVDIFAHHIAPPLGISLRFVGSEPTDPLTAAYNQAMLTILPPRNIRVVVIPRLEVEQEPVCAALVRKLWQQRDIRALAKLVPASTLKLLLESCSQQTQ